MNIATIRNEKMYSTNWFRNKSNVHSGNDKLIENWKIIPSTIKVISFLFSMICNSKSIKIHGSSINALTQTGEYALLAFSRKIEAAFSFFDAEVIGEKNKYVPDLFPVLAGIIL